MTIVVRYWSWLRDLVGTDHETFEIPNGGRVSDLLQLVHARHPRLAEARRSTLIAVGLDYRPETCALNPNDEVSLLPPVQGG